MPINKTSGEYIEALGNEFRVMPTQLYANTEEFTAACDYAKEKFEAAQCLESPVRFGPDDVVAQFYYNIKPVPKLVFVFCKRCRGGLDAAEGPTREAHSVERYVTFEYSVISPTVAGFGTA